MIQQKVEQLIVSAFEKGFDMKPEALALTQPDIQFGDFAVACHRYAKDLKKSPQEIAEVIAEHLNDPMIVNASAVAGYINITITPEVLAKEVLSAVIDEGHAYGTHTEQSEKVVIEYSQPNTNKPLHLGHIRNNVLGMSIGSLMKSAGFDVFLADVVNDRGIHITKSMVAYMKWGEGATPETTGEKGDHFVGRFYVLFEKEFEREWQEWLKDNPEVPGLSDEEKSKRRQAFFIESHVGQEAQELLRKWEAEDPDVRRLWKQMNQWVYDGFNETYTLLGSEFDKKWYESDTYLLGKQVIEQGLADGIFEKRDDNSIWVDLTEEGLDHKLLLRGDGTSVYITQDLGLAVTRHKELHFDRMIYVVGHEQEYHFKVLFATLKKLGYDWAENMHHLSYGLVFLPEGKMKSREGKVIDADNIMQEVIDLAAEEITKRSPDLAETLVAERAQAVGLGALKFLLLRVTPTQSIHYDPREAISFEGSTGPYVQYAHARISSMLEEETALPTDTVDLSLLATVEERAVLLQLLQYPSMIAEATKHYNPATVCTYLITLAQAFNSFYHACPVLKADSEELKHARLILSKAVQTVLRNGLGVLGIEAPEKM